MEKFMLSSEGRTKFKRSRIRMSAEESTMEGFDILEYLYDHGAATIEEIQEHTGKSYEQVVHKIESFLPWGYIEKLQE